MSKEPESTAPKDGFGGTLTIVQPRLIRTVAFDWDFEIQVALPSTYGSKPDKHYPVLWLTDGNYSFYLAIGLLDYLSYDNAIPEMVVVAVGTPRAAPITEWGRRRSIEFAPPGRGGLFTGLGAEVMRKRAGDQLLGIPQKGDDFLAFLVDELRPSLAREFRMADDHTLFGHSVGGGFACFAMFARPGCFRRYIIVSPYINAADGAAFDLEKQYAARATDMKADVFFGAGEKEIGDLEMNPFGIVSSSALMAETLSLRRYASLKISTRIFPGKDHFSVIAEAIVEGLHAVWCN
jgi:predicted alpha/beta superfamily hydrolase